MFVSGIKKPLLLAASLVLAVALGACGDFEGDYSQSNKVGPAGPTIPGGYYFDLTLSPSVIQLSGDTATITIKTYVWDAAGVGVPNVTVFYGGDFKVEDVAYVTDSNGYSSFNATITGIVTEGVRQSVSATVEDVSLTASYKNIPVGGI